MEKSQKDFSNVPIANLLWEGTRMSLSKEPLESKDEQMCDSAILS